MEGAELASEFSLLHNCGVPSKEVVTLNLKNHRNVLKVQFENQNEPTEGKSIKSRKPQMFLSTKPGTSKVGTP